MQAGQETSGAISLPIFEPDKPTCSVCDVTFTMFLRPHHCRLCGVCCCDTCSKGRADLGGLSLGLGESERVCNLCDRLAKI